MTRYIRNLSVFTFCFLGMLPVAYAQAPSPEMEKRLLLFTHYIATSINTYSPEDAAAISAKVMSFAVGSEKTSLREFLESQAAYIIREGITSDYEPRATSFKITVHEGNPPTYTTSMRGKRTATLVFEGKEMQTNDLMGVELDVASFKTSAANPFGLILTAYREDVLE